MAAISSDILYDFYCHVCEEDNVSTEAIFYCQQCSKGYCGQCIGNHKQLFKKHEPYGRGEMDRWPVAKKILDTLKFCEHHTDHPIDMFCEDHSKLCCARCLFHDHRHCGKLVLIEEKAQNIQAAADFRQMSKTIADSKLKLEITIHDTQICLKRLQDSYDKAYEEIKVLRKKINDVLDEMERKTLNSLDNMLRTLKQSFESDVDKSSKATHDFKKMSDVMNNVRDSPNELSFIAYRKSLEMVSQAENLLKEMLINNNPTITFHRNPDIEQTLTGFSSLGNIEGSEKLSEKGAIIKCKNKSLHDVRIQSDKITCDIRGICELPSGDILIVDHNNKRVKLLDKQYNVVAHTDMPASPWDMCSISPSEVAVTCYDGYTPPVQFLSVNNIQIVKGRTLNFKHGLHGIVHCNDNLYITSQTALYQYTLDGRLVKKIYEDTSGWNAVYKCAVSPDGTRLYVTNYGHNKLLTLSMDGTLLSSLEDPALRGPTGIHVSETGQLLVCGYGSHNVVQVDGVGEVVTLASNEDGLNHPESVYYSARTGRLIVGHNSDKILVITTK